jgi:hypothetical protein
MVSTMMVSGCVLVASVALRDRCIYSLFRNIQLMHCSFDLFIAWFNE